MGPIRRGSGQEKVLVVDRVPLYRAGLRGGLVQEWPEALVLEGGTAEEGARLARAERPSVAFVDVDLPDRNGIELCLEMRRSSPGTRVVITSLADSDVFLDLAWCAGAAGFIHKVQELAPFLTAMNLSARERMFTLAQRSRIKAWQSGMGAGMRKITPRQLEALELVLHGRTNPDIAKRLEVTVNTANRHLDAVFDAMGVGSRSALFAVMRDNNIQVWAIRLAREIGAAGRADADAGSERPALSVVPEALAWMPVFPRTNGSVSIGGQPVRG